MITDDVRLDLAKLGGILMDHRRMIVPVFGNIHPDNIGARSGFATRCHNRRRSRKRDKRGKDWRRVAFDNVVAELAILDTEIVDFRDALQKLATLDGRQARVVELRLFAGLSVEEIATVLQVSKRTVEGDWMHAKAWLRAELGPDDAKK